MASPSGLLSVIMIAVAILSNVSADIVTYNVTFVPCNQGSTCPQGNPNFYNRTFALNGVISPDLYLHVGDQLVFNLQTTLTAHLLEICKNSTVPNFCKGAANSDLLSTQLTQAGTSTSVTFNTTGDYFYGCYNHQGMGATIHVTLSTEGD
jgi:hypothetical protein